jgi:hypothetical protein
LCSNKQTNSTKKKEYRSWETQWDSPNNGQCNPTPGNHFTIKIGDDASDNRWSLNKSK